MKDVENKTKIQLVSRHGTLKPINLLLSLNKLDYLRFLLNSDCNSVSDVADLELSAYNHLGRNYKGTCNSVFSYSQCVRIRRHEIGCDYYDSFVVL